ncbi:MAG: hypothetical protein VX519_04835 [Myxococcota bacterium]|nr:hypothetical protein [Myxococcota bacterium]
MLSYQVYKIVHILGLAGIFAALGGLTLHALNGGTREDNPSRRLLVATHGMSLFLMLVGGMGMLARIGITSGLPVWAWLKLILWGLIGGLVSVILRKPALAKPIWFLLPILAGAGAWIALYKPMS